MCDHDEFDASVSVTRTEQHRFLATVRIRCVQCGEYFQFFGSAPGLEFNGIRTSVDGVELRAAIGTPETLQRYYEAAAGIRLPEIKREKSIRKKVEPFIPEPKY